MKIIDSTQVEKEPLNTPLFTGTDVTKQVLLSESEEYDISIVGFGKGVRNKFHAHDVEQILIITDGRELLLLKMKKGLLPSVILF